MDAATIPWNDKKWTKDASGNLVMPALQSEYLDWLLDEPRVPRTEPEWCDEHNVPHGTVKKWKQDRRFREQWERRAAERNISPERLNKVVDVLYEAATRTGDVGAAKQYILYSERLAPPKAVKRDASVMQLSDAELRAEVEGILATGFGT